MRELLRRLVTGGIWSGFCGSPVAMVTDVAIDAEAYSFFVCLCDKEADSLSDGLQTVHPESQRRSTDSPPGV